MAGTSVNFDKYWTVGKGGLAIRWNTPGHFTRCVRKVGPKAKENGFSAEGYCARLHKAMTIRETRRTSARRADRGNDD